MLRVFSAVIRELTCIGSAEKGISSYLCKGKNQMRKYFRRVEKIIKTVNRYDSNKNYESEKFNTTVQLNRNLKGIDLEKRGKHDAAMRQYELNVKENAFGTHPYDRLAVYYRKMNDYDNEIRVLKVAIQVYSKNMKQEQPRKRYEDRLKRAIYLKDKTGK